MMWSRERTGVVLAFALLVLTACSTDAPFSPPPADLQEADLVGEWEVKYNNQRVDRLILRADGTFKQIYRDSTKENYMYETPWNPWRLERFADGRMRLHFEGAGYYFNGIWWGELDGRHSPGPVKDFSGTPPPYSFYDSVGRESIYMVNKLVLNVRWNQKTGELLFMHMWGSSDGGFAIIGGDAEIFHRVPELKAARLVLQRAR